MFPEKVSICAVIVLLALVGDASLARDEDASFSWDGFRASVRQKTEALEKSPLTVRTEDALLRPSPPRQPDSGPIMLDWNHRRVAVFTLAWQAQPQWGSNGGRRGGAISSGWFPMAR